MIAEDVKKRLMKMAREVDGLTWADRLCIGQAIALIGVTSPAPAQAPEPNSAVKAAIAKTTQLLLDNLTEQGVKAAMQTLEWRLTKFPSAPFPEQSEPRAPVLSDAQIDAAIESWYRNDLNHDRTRMRGAIDAALAAQASGPDQAGGTQL